MSFLDVFLNVLAVLGIIALGAFIIVFLSDLLISIIDNSNGIFFRRKKGNKERENYSRPKMLPTPEQDYEKITYDENKDAKSVKVVEQDTFDGIDYEKAREEEQLISKPAKKVEPVVAIDDEDEKNAERLRLIEQRRKEYEQIQMAKEEPKPVEEEFDENEINNIIAEVSKESLKELEEEAKIKAKQEVLQEIEAQTQIEKEQLEQQIEELRRQLADANTNVESLTKQISETPVEQTVVSGMTREEIEDRLVILRQRLKDNEKELSINKKDYLPLRRVSATLDSDKKKLRRKEAIVAKQKVLLYGVNNYVDIDEEKAKKLAEELDLLEGLRLSVQHCEEVMNSNKDRYPILEKTNKILKKNVEDIKSDIAVLEAELESISSDEDDDNK